MQFGYWFFIAFLLDVAVGPFLFVRGFIYKFLDVSFS